jgi:hypothetical protein
MNSYMGGGSSNNSQHPAESISIWVVTVAKRLQLDWHLIWGGSIEFSSVVLQHPYPPMLYMEGCC